MLGPAGPAHLSRRAATPPALPPSDKIRVIAAVIRRGDRVLVCQRPAHKRHGGLWEFPGGKLEPGEDIESAARRELAEELNVRVTHVGDVEFAIDDPGSQFVIEFHSVEITGEPECHEHDEVRWVGREELAAMRLAPSDREYARVFAATGIR